MEKRLYLLWGLLLEKLRAGGNQRIHKPGAIPAGAAASLFNAALNEVVIASLRLDDVEIVLAPAGVNVRVAGVLLLFPFMVGFQRPRDVYKRQCPSSARASYSARKPRTGFPCPHSAVNAVETPAV